MAMENGPVEDVFPIKILLKMVIFYCYVSLPEGIQPQDISPYLKQEKKLFQPKQKKNAGRETGGQKVAHGTYRAWTLGGSSQEGGPKNIQKTMG